MQIAKPKQNLNHSLIAIAVILFFSMWFQLYAKRWNHERIIEWDVISYYSYLPATFIYKDLSLEFVKQNPSQFGGWFWPLKANNGNYVVKMTMGMSILYSPFFAIAHFMAEPLGYEPSGYSIPYRFAISIGALFYLMLGLILLRKLLLRHFSDTATAITLILVTLGTNLTWYASIEPGMSHVYSFTLFVVFIYLLEKWLERATITNTILLGALSGLISLVRPTNAAIGVLFLLWGISNRMELKERLKLLYARWPYIYTMIAVAICIWIPQMLYWKMQTGHFIHHSYGQEGFFFFSPNITDGLFSFRKGWLLYTPTMAIALLGLILLPKYSKGRTISIAAFTFINIYIIFSWWCWWYGGSFGARAFIESYALLSFPLAALVQWAFSKKIYIKIASMIFFTLLLAHSILQTFQYYYGAIHWDSMTREAYFDSLGRLKASERFWGLIAEPDYSAAMKGLPEKEIKKSANKESNPTFDPNTNDYHLKLENIRGDQGQEFISINQQALDSQTLPINIRVRIEKESSIVPKKLLLAFSVTDSTGKTQLYRDLDIYKHFNVGNGADWQCAIDNIPASGKLTINTFIWSQNKQNFNLKNLEILYKYGE